MRGLGGHACARRWLSIGLSLGWILLGAIAFLICAKAEHTWPFGPKEIKEAFVDAP